MRGPARRRASTGKSRHTRLRWSGPRAGDRDAFGQLYKLYAPMVHGILLARVPWREVEDLLQDTFLISFKKLHTLRDENAFGAWLAMITPNCAMQFHRHAPAAEPLSEDLASQAIPPHKAEALNLVALVQEMPEAYHETLILRLVEGFTGPEIAACTGLTAASVRVNLHRGMKLLREKIGAQRGI
ncbi:MAG: RNA polymerase sigma factor [Blastocatellia bacterium]